MKRKIAWGRVLLLCLFILLITFTVMGVTIWNYAFWDEAQPADVVIVLGAAVENNEPTPVFRERINHGISLYQDGLVKYILFTGGIGDNDTQSEAAVAREYAIANGVPADAILIEEQSHITEENLQNAKRIMADCDLKTAILVSDPLHMKRAMTMAEDYGLKAYSSPTPTTMYQSLKSQIPFLLREIVMYIGYCMLRPFR